MTPEPIDFRLYRRLDELHSNQFFELAPGTREGGCWRDGSVFIYDYAWSYLEAPLLKHADGYSRWAFVDVSAAAWDRILTDWRELAGRLRAAGTVDDVADVLHFEFGTSRAALAADFPANAAALAHLADELVAWAWWALAGRDGIAVLGL